MRVRQSHLKLWQDCPLKFRYEQVDGLPRLQSGSAVFGSIIHACVHHLETTGDLEGTLERFRTFWRTPELYDPDPAEHRIDYYVRGSSWQKFMDRGVELLRRWWDVIQWESDLVLGREYYFEVPIGRGHTLVGTVDKLAVRWRAPTEEWVVLISDYKTNAKTPTYNYLEEDLQFSAYSYASTCPEFWEPLFPDDPGAGLALWRKYQDLARYGEWVALTTGKRMDAGIRTNRHYNRLAMAVNALADSVDLRIFVPNISGESCAYCEYRQLCGLPEYVPPDQW